MSASEETTLGAAPAPGLGIVLGLEVELAGDADGRTGMTFARLGSQEGREKVGIPPHPVQRLALNARVDPDGVGCLVRALQGAVERANVDASEVRSVHATVLALLRDAGATNVDVLKPLRVWVRESPWPRLPAQQLLPFPGPSPGAVPGESE